MSFLSDWWEAFVISGRYEMGDPLAPSEVEGNREGDPLAPSEVEGNREGGASRACPAPKRDS
jgi:hypothetical protein